jgi:uncharacterized protein (TIGR02145 family)
VKPFFSIASLGAAVLALSFQAVAADIALSGTVFGTDNKPLAGVTVMLSQAGLSTTTDAAGVWNLGPLTTGIASRRMLSRASEHLVLENGRLQLSYGGVDAAGRGKVALQPISNGAVATARAQSSQDTLLYWLGGKVRLRDTLTNLQQTGIVRLVDATFNPSIVYGYLTDSRDGQTYRTVKIGSQVWMTQNLNFAKNTGSTGVDTGKCYKNSTDSCKKYGRLYTWAQSLGLNDSCSTKSCLSLVATKQKGICPSGWHVPSDAEWTTMLQVVDAGGTVVGARLKSTSWWPHNPGTDAYGFRALPGGFAYGYSFTYDGYGSWWSATEFDASNAWGRDMIDSTSYVTNGYNSKAYYGFSLRCLQD